MENKEPELETVIALDDLRTFMRWYGEGSILLDEQAMVNEIAEADGLALLSFLIFEGAPLDGDPDEGESLLHYTVRGNSVRSAEFLLHAGANPDVMSESIDNEFGLTPLALAAREGNFTLASRLLSAGANPFFLETNDEDPFVGNAPLVLASGPEMLRLLITAVSSQHATDGRVIFAAAEKAIRDGDLKRIQILIHHARDIEAWPMGLMISVGAAFSSSLPEFLTCIRTLLSRGLVPELTEMEELVLPEIHQLFQEQGVSKYLEPRDIHQAIYLNDQAALESFANSKSQLEMQNSQFLTPLQIAIRIGNDAFALILLKKGASSHEYPGVVAAAAEHGRTTLMGALARRGWSMRGARSFRAFFEKWPTPLHMSVEHAKGLRFLIRMGVPIDPKDSNGRTPLHWAALKLQPTSVRYLLAAGADPKMRDARNETPLDLLPSKMTSDARNHAACRKLLESG